MKRRLLISKLRERRGWHQDVERASWFLALTLVLTGCSRGPERVSVPTFDPVTMTSQAIEKNDADKDGTLTAEELRGWPGLRAALPVIDANKNSKIERAELETHLESYKVGKIGLQSLTCFVTVGGKSLDGAVVEFHPEEFMQGVLKAAHATTNSDGAGFVLPIEKGLPGIQPGIYRVTISKKNGDREMLPKRYNTETELGFVVSSASGGAPAQFKLEPR